MNDINPKSTSQELSWVLGHHGALTAFQHVGLSLNPLLTGLGGFSADLLSR
jgi:hypothetical protein